jgi:hypothetical protein
MRSCSGDPIIEARAAFGFDYDCCRDCPADNKTRPEDLFSVDPIYHQQFNPCLIVRNDVKIVVDSATGKLLDPTLPADRWLLLTSLPGGGAKTITGHTVREGVFRSLWDLITGSNTHPLCHRIASLEQVKSWINASDIERCSPNGCVFNYCAEALVRLCRMRGIDLTTDLIADAFPFQMELERTRRALDNKIENAQQAFIQLLKESVC